MSCRVVAASAPDVGSILTLIRGLAEYERLAHEVVATEDGLRRTLFGPQPAAEALLAYVDATTAPVGFALFFGSYSTFLARAGVYLEDLFVQPAYRGRGVGRALFKRVARIAVERDAGRLEWSVLDWNEPALKFYRAMGAQPMSEWTVQRLTGQALLHAALPANGA
jgi:GNAT superfamily N-acetyltransferase